MSEQATTLRALAEHRRERDLPTHVHVVGDLDADPPKGLATAKRVAALLADEDGTVRDEDYGELDDGDVAFVMIEDRPRSPETYEEYAELLELARVSRVKLLSGIIVFSEAITTGVEKVFDARVWAESDGVDRVERLQRDGYGHEAFATELDGLGAGTTHADHISECEDCRPGGYFEASGTMVKIARGELDADEWLCPDHLEDFERGTAEYAVGTRDLDEADRRWAVIDEWYREN